MLRACFNCYHNYTTDNVYQWDLNHVLEIKGLTLDYAPTVHFCNKKSTEAIVVQSELVDDAITVDVPNELLQEPFNIMAYIHTYDANNAKTIELVNIPLIKRIKPSDYQFTGNIEIMNFERLEKDFTDFVNQVEADFLAYKEEANAHIDERIDDYIAKGYVNWENVLLKPSNITYMNTEDNTEIEAPEDPGDNSDSKDNVVTFTSGDGDGDAWTGVATLKSGEKHSSIFSKISTMFNNIRYLYKMLGTTDISDIGDGTTTGAINTLNSNLDTKQNYLSIGAFAGNVDMVTFDGADNTLPQNSIAWVHNTEATGNHPAEYYVLETFIAMTGIITQKATQYIYQGTPIIHTRMYVNEAWSNWDSAVNQSTLTEHSLVGIPAVDSIVNTSEPYSAIAWKNGKTVTIKCFVSQAYMFSGKAIFNIPEGYRPKVNTTGEIIAIRHSTLISNSPLSFGNSVTINTEGQIIQNFNNEGHSVPWQFEIFATYTVE